MEYSLIIPIYNEEKTLDTLLSQLKNLDSKIEIIIINDGSTDNTKIILEKGNGFKLINNSKNLGKGSSILKGANIATNDNIILMDGDLEIDLESVTRLISKHESRNREIIIASRWNENNNIEPGINTYGNYFLNFFFNNLYKTKLKDVLCCLKILNKDVFDSLNIKSKRFSIEVEIMAKLAAKGLKFYEVDVLYQRRSVDQGKKLKISDGWSILWKMITVKFYGN